MKNNMIKKVILLAMALIMVLSMTACLDPSEDGNDMKTITVKISIDYPDMDDDEEMPIADTDEAMIYPADIEDYKIKVESGATAMQILEAFASQNDIEVIVDESSSTYYVTSIGGVAASANTGWVYEVNDETVMEPASDYVPSNRDEITWEFIEF